MTGWLDRPLLELDSVDVDGAESVTYLLHQVFRYAYDGPAYRVRQRLVGLPRARYGNLRRRARHVLVADSAGSAYRAVIWGEAWPSIFWTTCCGTPALINRVPRVWRYWWAGRCVCLAGFYCY